MNLLFLGGTGFVGKHMVEQAVANGHDVTLFNRNRTNSDLFPATRRLIGDRDGDLSALTGDQWDAVVDVNGYVPRVVGDSARLLKDQVGHYLFVSTGSVYDGAAVRRARNEQPLDETTPLEPTDGLGTEQYWGEAYGGLKALCEQVVREYYPANSTILRLGVVAGPDDPTDRMTYWVDRASRGGDILVPGSPEWTLQFIDVDDLAAFTLRALEKAPSDSSYTGTFNTIGNAFTWGEWMQACSEAAGTEPTLHWVDDINFLVEHTRDCTRPFGALPMMSGTGGQMVFDSSRAAALGLSYRSPVETAANILAWHSRRNMTHNVEEASPVERARSALDWGSKREQAAWMAGLAPEEEAEILARWRCSKDN